MVTAAEADRAYEEWGANCGPGAIAAVLKMSLDEVRPFMVAAGFADKLYTNPTMMNDVLRAIGHPWRKIGAAWPSYGLARIQWEGPWTEPGVPMRARYRYTHWVGSWKHPERGRGIFDINMLNNGSGWATLENWSTLLVPQLTTAQNPRCTGKWHITHGIEVAPATTGQADG